MAAPLTARAGTLHGGDDVQKNELLNILSKAFVELFNRDNRLSEERIHLRTVNSQLREYVKTCLDEYRRRTVALDGSVQLPDYEVHNYYDKTPTGACKLTPVSGGWPQVWRRAKPAIIVHQPGHNNGNVLAIEFKQIDKSQDQEIVLDFVKAVGYVRSNDLRYRYALCVCIHADCVHSRALLLSQESFPWEELESRKPLIDELYQIWQGLLYPGQVDVDRERARVEEIVPLLGFEDVSENLFGAQPCA